MPQMGQLPGASRTISGCIGQVYFMVGLLAVAGSAVLQPVRAAKAAPTNSASIIVFILFMVLSFVAFSYCRQPDGNWFVHSFAFRRRSALAMTETELKLMAAPAMMGLKSRPKNG